MDFRSKAVQGLITELERLPGIGRKTAERLAYHLLRTSENEAMQLAYAIGDVKKNVRFCSRCFHLTESELCDICQDATRDRHRLCVVEQPKDLYAIEGSGAYRGLYHVLLGVFAPLDGVEPKDLTIDPLLQRVRTEGIQEVILATNPTFEGEGTALFLVEKLKEMSGVKVTRIARGIPSGSHLEYASRNIVADALEGRREMEN